VSNSGLKVLAFLIVLIGGAVTFWYYYDDLVSSGQKLLSFGQVMVQSRGFFD
jgi:hypothetical protein